MSHPFPGADDLAAVTEPHRPFDPQGATLIILAPDDPGRLADAAEKAPTRLAARHHHPAAPARPHRDRTPRRRSPSPAPRSRGSGCAPPPCRSRTRATPPCSWPTTCVGGHLVRPAWPEACSEDKGYVYGIMSYFDLQPGNPLLAIEADTAAATTSAAPEVLAGELHRLDTHPPTDREVHAARAYALGSAATCLASWPPRERAGRPGRQIGRPADAVRLRPRIGAVTTDEVVAATASYLNPAVSLGVVAADPAALPETLSLVRRETR